MMFMSYERSFSRLLFVMCGLFVVCAGIASGFGSRSPNIEPVAPHSDLLLLPASAAVVPMTGEADDFVSRPLFEVTRQPPASEEEVVPEQTEVESAVSSIDDTKLVGVFASRTARGVILTSGRGRERLLIGEEFKGWTLTAVEARSAIFVTGKGRKKRQAKLDMTVTTILSPAELSALSVPSPEEAEESSQNSPDDRLSGSKLGAHRRSLENSAVSNAGLSGQDGKKVTGSVQGMLTFEKMYGEQSPKDGDDNNGD